MSQFTGNLEQDSKGLYVRFQSSFDTTQSEPLSRVYEEVFDLGGCDEGATIRTPGVSFNPRPARIAQIVMDDFEVRGFAEVGAALCMPLPNSSRFRMKVATLQMLEICSQARLYYEEGIESCQFEVRLLAAAYALDRVRHLHMSGEHFERKREILEHVSKMTVDQLGAPEAAVARVKLESAVSMQLRRLK